MEHCTDQKMDAIYGKSSNHTMENEIHSRHYIISLEWWCYVQCSGFAHSFDKQCLS